MKLRHAVPHTSLHNQRKGLWFRPVQVPALIGSVRVSAMEEPVWIARGNSCVREFEKQLRAGKANVVRNRLSIAPVLGHVAPELIDDNMLRQGSNPDSRFNTQILGACLLNTKFQYDDSKDSQFIISVLNFKIYLGVNTKYSKIIFFFESSILFLIRASCCLPIPKAYVLFDLTLLCIRTSLQRSCNNVAFGAIYDMRSVGITRTYHFGSLHHRITSNCTHRYH